jgi:hypothetical protein
MSSTDTDATSPPFSVLLAFADVHDLTVAEVVAAIHRLHPNARVTFWGGTGEPAQAARGILLSVDGLDMAIIHQRFAAPLAFDGGNQPSFCWQNAADELSRQKSHLFVMEAGRGKLSHSVARAGLVTIVADAIASLNPPMGVRWESARNLMRADHFTKLAAEFRARGTIPVALWIRLLSAYRSPATAGVVATFGLQTFGSPDVEVHARRLDFASTMSAALSYAQAWLTTGRPTWDETVTTIEGIATFAIKPVENGLFDIGPVAQLTELQPGEAPSDVRVATGAAVEPFRTAEDRVSGENILYNTLLLQVAGGIRNAFYQSPKETWGQARARTTRQLDGFFEAMEPGRPR